MEEKKEEGRMEQGQFYPPLASKAVLYLKAELKAAPCHFGIERGCIYISCHQRVISRKHVHASEITY